MHANVHGQIYNKRLMLLNCREKNGYVEGTVINY